MAQVLMIPSLMTFYLTLTLKVHYYGTSWRVKTSFPLETQVDSPRGDFCLIILTNLAPSSQPSCRHLMNKPKYLLSFRFTHWRKHVKMVPLLQTHAGSI